MKSVYLFRTLLLSDLNLNVAGDEIADKFATNCPFNCSFYCNLNIIYCQNHSVIYYHSMLIDYITQQTLKNQFLCIFVSSFIKNMCVRTRSVLFKELRQQKQKVFKVTTLIVQVLFVSRLM